MDQETARVLFERGAALVLRDVPQGTECGIDFNAWYVGPRFMGVKMIPPGPHFLFYSAVDKYGQHSPRSGIFFFAAEKDILVQRWDKSTEDFVEDTIDKEKIDLRNLDSNLAPYPYENFGKWKTMTCFITRDTFERVNPSCGRLNPLTEINNSSLFTRKEMERLSIASAMAQDKTKLIRFTELPKERYPQGSAPKDITKYNMDSSYALERYLSQFKESAEGELFGEVQFAFVAFLHGHVYDAFEHWKNVVQLVLTCEDCISQKTKFFCSFLDMLQFQLLEIPQDFFVDIVSQNNFLVQTLRVFFSNFESPGEYPSTLEANVRKLKASLMKHFLWDFETGNPEDEPVVVDC